MSMLRSIEFENNRTKVCYSGQLLNGKANIFLPDNVQIKAIYMTFVGKGFCKWTTGSRGKSKTVTGSKIYLKEKIYLLRSGDANTTIVPAGDHEYPFSIQLSTKLATSYEGTFGYVRYVVALHIERLSQEIEPLKANFTIIRPLNLNNQTLFRMPMERQICAKFNEFCFFFCWKTSDLKIFGRLPVSGYCPGETMKLKLDIINQSDKDVLHIVVHFIKEVTYRSNEGLKRIERVVLIEKTAEGCRGNRNGIKSLKVNIMVPSLPPTNFSTDNVCGFNYFFRVTAVTGFCHRDPMLQIPVIIGTYPILDDNSLILCRSPSNMSLSSCDPPPYSEPDLPTYEESVGNNGPTNDQFVSEYPTIEKELSTPTKT